MRPDLIALRLLYNTIIGMDDDDRLCLPEALQFWENTGDLTVTSMTNGALDVIFGSVAEGGRFLEVLVHGGLANEIGTWNVQLVWSWRSSSCCGSGAPSVHPELRLSVPPRQWAHVAELLDTDFREQNGCGLG